MKLKNLFSFVVLSAFLFTLKAKAAHFMECQVKDPTGTPLNVRDKPYGKIMTTLRNGHRVAPIIEKRVFDKKGNAWIPVTDGYQGKYLGYVYEKYLFCYYNE